MIFHKILLITSKKIIKPGTKIIGDTLYSPLGDPEVEDYIELLSACNMNFEVKYHDEIKWKDIIDKDIIKYSTIVQTVPEKEVSNELIEMLKKASYDYGISLLASYNRVAKEMSELFGIKRIRGKKMRFPCSIVIRKEKILNNKVQNKIEFGDGLKIQFDRFGLRKDPVRYIKKHFKKFWNQVFFYIKIDIDTKTDKLAVMEKNNDSAIIRFKYGKAVNYYIALHHDFYLDRFNSIHSLVREILQINSGRGMVSVNLENTMVLRMDDPGTCERVYLQGYDWGILSKQNWEEINEILEKYQAKLCVMYIPIWVDDGNSNKGNIIVKGKKVKKRKKGSKYFSKDVYYLKKCNDSGDKKYDYNAEFKALESAVKSGVVEIESHGLTHVDTNLKKWLKAKDRYSNSKWFHEFRHVAEKRDNSYEEQYLVMKQSSEIIEKIFNIAPVAITPSGHVQSENSEEISFEIGYKLFSSDYNSICKNHLIIRNDKIRSLFFEDECPHKKYSQSGYPLVGVFHDYDVIKNGDKWLEEIIKGWINCGINKFITFRKLVGYLCSTITSFLTTDQLVIEIDIANTGNVSGEPKGRYFSNHIMAIYIRLPINAKQKSIFVENVLHHNYEFFKESNLIHIKLPPFEEKNQQRIVIDLEFK
jgi:hypothetical protein